MALDNPSAELFTIFCMPCGTSTAPAEGITVGGEALVETGKPRKQEPLGLDRIHWWSPYDAGHCHAAELMARRYHGHPGLSFHETAGHGAFRTSMDAGR